MTKGWQDAGATTKAEDSRPARCRRYQERLAMEPGLSIRQRKRLPHWEAAGGTYFVTFRLFDSLAQIKLRSILAERDDIVATAKQMRREISAHEAKRLRKLTAKRVEKFLDAGGGSCYLSRPGVAGVVSEVLRHFDGVRYRLFAWCVMPNHVHAVFQPMPGNSLARIVHTWKSYSALHANRILRRTGKFWQREYYDHLIRDERQFVRAIRYVAENPIRAGLRDWPWVGVRAKD